MSRKNKRRIWYHVEDNTVLNCPGVTYRFNRDTYRFEKNIYWIVALFSFFAAIVVMILSDSAVIQSIAGAFMGGILSLIVWLLTIRQQDHMNYELANIDLHIMAIEEHLEFIHSKVQFIDPDEYEMVEADSRSLVYRFMHLFQLCVFIACDEKIDSSQLKLRFSDGIEYSIKEYTEKCDKLCQDKFADLIILQEKWSKITDWNYYIIDRHLRELKKKLCRYKIYIECGNAPQEYYNK